MLSIASFICLLFYSVIAAQSISYIISLKDVQVNMTVQEYIPFRRSTDKNFRAKFAFFVYGALISNLALVILTIVYVEAMLLIFSAISFLALMIDTYITMKGNMPINDAINTWTIDNYPGDWETQRKKWLQYFSYRQMANLTGFMCLLIGIVFF